MKKLVAFTIAAGLLVSPMVTQHGVVHAQTVTKVSNTKVIKGYTLQYTVPKNMDVVLHNNQVIFKRNGMVIGGIEFLKYDGKQDPKTLLPSHSTVLDKRAVKGLALPCVRYLTQSEDMKAYHSLLLDAKKKRAFDFWANSKLMTDQEIKDIRASIKVLR